MGRDADAAQPDQHRHRPRRPHLGRRRRSLPLASRPAARRRPHRRARRHRRRRQGRRARTRSCRSRRSIAPLGVSVIDNKIVVSQPPDLIVYTDVDRNLRFDPAVDKREVLLTGFQGINHDHSLHSVTVGPDGKWLFNSGNMGGDVHRQVRQDVPVFGVVSSRPGRPVQVPARPREIRRQAERRRARVRRRLHGADEPRRHERRDHRLQLPQQLRAVDDLARRRLPERQRRPAGVPRQLGHGVRELRLLVERRAAHAGRPTAGPGSRCRWPSGARTIRG